VSWLIEFGREGDRGGEDVPIGREGRRREGRERVV